MRNKKIQKLTSVILATAMTVSMLATSMTSVYAADSPPMIGDQARKENQPKFSGYRVWDIRDWNPEEDPGSEFLRAGIPLQIRNDPFKPTQANPTLDSKAQVMLMQGDYGDAFVDGMMYNNTFSQNTLNFWQYTDYFSPWHGAATSTSPEDLYDYNLENTDPNGWQKRYFEFGVLNIPNPAYTNAAHKNGTKSIACIYFDQSFRQGQTINELFVQDKDGNFPVAEKLIQMASYFGYDGYFFNAEESVDAKYAVAKKKFLARLTASGLWTQYYDTNSTMNESKSQWLETEIDGAKTKIQDSVFVNYGWPGSFDSAGSNIDYMTKNGIDPFAKAFYGVEANQGKFSGGHPTANSIPQLYAPNTKNPRASIALFTPSDFYQRGDGITAAMQADPDYQWMIAERERMYFSGVLSDPTKTGNQTGFGRPEVLAADASKWVGVADFTSERSVTKGSNFYTNFNTGKGMQYFNNGKVSRDDQWTNITVQDVLPSWQWWVETPEIASTPAQPGDPAPEKKYYEKLKVDFDYGEKYFTGATEFERVGAYNGGSSLVVAGNLKAQNLLRLQKTDLAVNANSKIDITYFKPSKTDGSEMKLALIFKDAPSKVEYISILGTGTKTSDWKTATADLSKFAGKELATIGLAFNPKQGEVVDYQMNIGALRLYDKSLAAPKTPTNFRIDRMFNNDELIVKWDCANFSEVEKYEIFATLSNGQKINVGSNYDSLYYIKSLLNEKDTVKLELVAIGKDGSKSAPAVIDFNYKDKVSNVSIEQVKKSVVTIPKAQVVGSVTQAENLGLLNISWTNPTTDYKNLKIDVTMDDSADKAVFSTIVNKGVNSTEIFIPRGHGESYKVAISTILSDGTLTAPINVTGKLNDVYVEPYDAQNATINGTAVTLWCPDSKDWFKIHATFNGQILDFSSRFVGSQQVAIRATTYMKTNLPAKDGILSIVVEDYSGNMSKPTIIPCGQGGTATVGAAVDATMFPDAALLAAVVSQAPTTDKLKDIITLDLTGTAISNLSGISALNNLTTLNLTNCTSLEMIRNGALSSNSKLKEINLTGCTGLKAASLANTSLEMVICTDVTKLTSLVSLNMSNSKFDMSVGTPEKAFADAIALQAQGKNDIVIKSNVKSNLAKGIKIQPASTMTNGNKLFDGMMSYFQVKTPSEAIIKFDSAQEIVGWKLINDEGTYGLSDFEVQYSNDGNTWNTLGTAVTGNKSEEVEQNITSIAPAQYYKFIAKKPMTSSAYLLEFELYGYATDTYKASVTFDNQKPVAYPKAPPTAATISKGTGEFDVRSILAIYQTVRGTNYASLKGQNFINPALNIDAQCGADKGLFAKITKSDSTVLYNKINTTNEGTYTVEYTTFNTPEITGKVLGTATLTISNVKDALATSIINGQSKDLSMYTKSTSDILKVALNEAIRIRDDFTIADATVIDNAKKAVDNAITGLIARADNSALKTIYDLNKDKLVITYTTSSWTPFKTAIDEAKVVLSNADATAAQILASKDKLALAASALIPRANNESLQALYNANKNNVETAYVTATWGQFKTALDAAKAAIDNTDASEATVETAKNNLDTAVKALVLRGDTVGLRALYEANKNNVETLYVADTWGQFKTALDAAKAVLDNVDAVQTAVAKANSDLDIAVKALVPHVDKTALQVLYAKNIIISQADFTAASWASFKTAIDAAKVVLDNEKASLVDISTAFNDLDSAISKLVKRPVVTPSTPTTPTSPTVDPTKPVESIPTDKVVEQINSGTAKVSVDLTKPDTISKDILKVAKEQKKVVTFNIVDTKGKLQYSWILDGKNVTDIKDINLELKISEVKAAQNTAIDKISNKTNGLVLSFSHSGSLPANTQVKTYVGDKFANGDKLFLYYFNEAKGQMESIAGGIIVTDGYATITINHCSDYVLTKTAIVKTSVPKVPATKAPTTKTPNPKTSDTTPILPIAMAIIVCAGYVVVTKKAKV